MMMLKNKKILIIIGGGIAAYKSLDLVRLLNSSPNFCGNDLTKIKTLSKLCSFV